LRLHERDDRRSRPRSDEAVDIPRVKTPDHEQTLNQTGVGDAVAAETSLWVASPATGEADGELQAALAAEGGPRKRSQSPRDGRRRLPPLAARIGALPAARSRLPGR